VHGTGPWQSQSFSPQVALLTVTGVKDGVTYDVQVRYRTARNVEDISTALSLGTVTVGAILISDQGLLATLNAIEAAQLKAPVGKNCIVDAEFRQAFNYWRAYATNTSSGSVGTSSGGIRYIRNTRVDESIGEYLALGSDNQVGSLPVVPGEPVEASAYVAGANLASVNIQLHWHDATGAQLAGGAGVSILQTATTGIPAGGGDLSARLRIGGFAAAPTGAARVSAHVVGVIGSGPAGAYVEAAKWMLCKALNANSTQLTPWNAGLDAEPGSDITSAHNSAGFAGQGSMATKNIFRQGTAPSSGMVSGDLWVKNNVTPNQVYQYDQSSAQWVKASASVATEILYGSGSTVESLKPGEANADVTSGHNSAGFAGQGSMATKNIFRQGTAPSSGMVSGDLWVKNNVTPNQVYQYDQSSAQWVKASTSVATEILYNSGVTLESLKPGEASADVTSGHNSAGFSGQGSMATKNIFRQGSAPTSGMVSGDLWIKNNVTPNQVNQYDQSSGLWVKATASLSTEIKYGDGIDLETWKPASTSADQTSSRTAAAIANQGTMATKNIFRQTTAPTSGMVSGDLWIQTSGPRTVYQYDQSSGVWAPASATQASDLIHNASGFGLNSATQYLNGVGCMWDWRGLPVNGTIGQAAVRNNVAPLTAPSTSQVSIGSATISLPNGSLSLPSGSVTGLSSDTAYHMFWDQESLVYLADSSLVTSRFTSTSQYLYLGQQRTPVSGSTFTAPNATPPGGGGVSANYCCSPDTPVMLACGQEIPAEKLEPGDLLRTAHEHTLAVGDYLVESVELGLAPRWRVVLGDGRVLIGSANHRVFVVGAGWTELQDLSPEAPLFGPRPAFVVDAHAYDVGPVVKLIVEGAHTYLTDGVLSHNTKYVYY
jgi:DnaJ-class molecular chaperone